MESDGEGEAKLFAEMTSPIFSRGVFRIKMLFDSSLPLSELAEIL